ncbi:gamma-tubulin complex component 3 homolog [Gigantopelta aegis]|uniref:gamma-tubulin complex component 3 homolog n=1 Tax=Gigantopelta aegis TaxID=1735272 RepID=UPI001B88C514|nr:gamma-tubulin complex component 3 homolog [Gigantopelta aegis]
MATTTVTDISSPSALLQRLCCKVTGLSDESVTPHYQFALRILGSQFETQFEGDEFQVSKKIKSQLFRKGRERDAAVFSELHRKLQSQNVLKNRWQVLHLLMCLSDSQVPANSSSLGSALFGRRLPAYATSTPFQPGSRIVPDSTPDLSGASALLPSTLHTTLHTTDSSGFSSIPSGISGGTGAHVHQSFAPSYTPTPGTAVQDRTGRNLGARLALGLSKPKDTDYSLVPRGRQTVSTSQSTLARGDNLSFEIPEASLIKDLMYCFQGIEGKWIKFDSGRESYRIDPQAGIPKAVRQLISKLAECGWLYNKIKHYVESRSFDKAFGLVGQSFCTALHEELTEYYRLIAVLEAQLQQEQDPGIAETSSLTLRRLAVWTFDPLVRLKILAALVDVCKGKKGGALASGIYSCMQHGDPFVRSVIKLNLTMVCQPIYATLLRWLYDGELEDTYHEFFVASDPTIKNDRLWNDKYSLRKSMIPTFITIDQAQRILLTGKSINFLRQVCQDRTPTKGREVAMTFDVSQAETMLTQDMNTEFQKMVDVVYKDTSQHLLDVLHNKYKFMDHLKAMRRYLLLGQGDFIRHLMDLLEEDLAKPASNLYLHNLTGILETAIRATNAQFDDLDILKRLDVRLLEVSPGDTGWDVFSLDYHVDGPIRTVFTPECIIMYLRVFNFLWRAKRMEYCLTLIWRNQMSNARALHSIPELWTILPHCHVLGCEMVHFIQQVQYYINFEVLECAWDELLTKVTEAKDLDYIIAAHQVFLDTVISRCLLDEKSRAILTQLRTIFDLIIQFQTAQENFYQAATSELEARQHFEDLKRKKTNEGQWGLTSADEEEESKRRAEFLKHVIPSTRAQLTVLAQSYQDMVQDFLQMLTSHQDVSLRFLSFRLDFNEHYRSSRQCKGALPYHQRKKRAV